MADFTPFDSPSIPPDLPVPTSDTPRNVEADVRSTANGDNSLDEVEALMSPSHMATKPQVSEYVGEMELHMSKITIDEKPAVPTKSTETETKTQAPDNRTAACNKEEKMDGFLGDRIIHLFVGPERVKYTIHERVLSNVAKDSFFSALFNSGFLETSTGRAEMPEDDPHLFDYVIKWFYATHVGVGDFGYLFDSLSFQRLFQLYTLGQKFLIDDFQDAIITIVFNRVREDYRSFFTIPLDTAAFNHFQNNVLPDSNMYNLVAKAMAVSILQAPASIYSEARYSHNCTGCSAPPHQESCTVKADKVLAVIPDELMRQMFSTMLRVAGRDCCKEFEQTVGFLDNFLLDKSPRAMVKARWTSAPVCSHGHHKPTDRCR